MIESINIERSYEIHTLLAVKLDQHLPLFDFQSTESLPKTFIFFTFLLPFLKCILNGLTN